MPTPAVPYFSPDTSLPAAAACRLPCPGYRPGSGISPKDTPPYPLKLNGDPQRRDKRPALLPNILHAVTLFRRRGLGVLHHARRHQYVGTAEFAARHVLQVDVKAEHTAAEIEGFVDTQVYLRKVAPLGDPLELTVRNYELSIRKADAAMVEIE